MLWKKVKDFYDVFNYKVLVWGKIFFDFGWILVISLRVKGSLLLVKCYLNW